MLRDGWPRSKATVRPGLPSIDPRTEAPLGRPLRGRTRRRRTRVPPSRFHPERRAQDRLTVHPGGRSSGSRSRDPDTRTTMVTQAGREPVRDEGMLSDRRTPRHETPLPPRTRGSETAPEGVQSVPTAPRRLAKAWWAWWRRLHWRRCACSLLRDAPARRLRARRGGRAGARRPRRGRLTARGGTAGRPAGSSQKRASLPGPPGPEEPRRPRPLAGRNR